MRFKGCLFQNLCGKAMVVLLFSPQVGSDSPRPHGLQHAWLPCPLLSPREGNGTRVAETVFKKKVRRITVCDFFFNQEIFNILLPS